MFLKAGVNTVHPLKQEQWSACPVCTHRTLCPMKRSYLPHLYLPGRAERQLFRQTGRELAREAGLTLFVVSGRDYLKCCPVLQQHQELTTETGP